MNKYHPYDETFLNRQMELHRYIFHKFLNDKTHDFYSIVDTYLQTSELRAKMDIGNLMALNTGGKGPLISINIFTCKKKDPYYNAPELYVVHWMADIYCMTQWMYNIPSKEISKNLPAKELASIYNNYYSDTLDNACRSIYHKYLSQIKPFDHIEKEEYCKEDDLCQE